ncbi:MAG: DNA polymerase III subunit chi [Legionellaceae bacterium]|nr:DNA polymerase III subunit chi [Legionellaceae bacterium]
MRVDFYLLKASDPCHFFCRFLEKMATLGHSVFLFSADLDFLEMLNDQLWTFKPESFIPHELYVDAQQSAPKAPIVLSTRQPDTRWTDILINYTASIPDFAQQFSRIIEIVPEEETLKSLARERYKQYQQRNYAVQMHTLD